MSIERRFSALGTEVRLIAEPPRGWGGDAGRLLADAADVFRFCERAFSRFDPSSELSRVNERLGRIAPISAQFQEVLETALWARGLTGGLFDPTLLRPLSEHGYDRSFGRLRRASAAAWRFPEGAMERPAAGQPSPPPGDACGEPPKPLGSVPLDLVEGADGRAFLRARQPLDFGGIAKGWAVDRAARVLGPLRNFLIDAGGDIRAEGHRDGWPWAVAVADPFSDTAGIDAGHLDLVPLSGCAIATSSITRRAWLGPRGSSHHIIDPRTMRPAETDVASATVVADTAVRAEALAKAGVILGSEAAPEWIESRGGSCLLVRRDGRVITSEGWEGWRSVA